MKRIDKGYNHLSIINGGITQAANKGQGYKISESKGNFYKRENLAGIAIKKRENLASMSLLSNFSACTGCPKQS